MLSGLSASQLNLVTAVTTVLGFLGLLAGFFYNLMVGEANNSVRNQLVGQPLLNRPETWKLLNEIKDPEKRVDKLKELHHIDEETARILLEKVGKIDANRTHEKSLERLRTTAFASGVFFLAIAFLALFDKFHPLPTPPVVATSSPAQTSPAALPSASNPAGKSNPSLQPIPTPAKPVILVPKHGSPYDELYTKAQSFLDKSEIPKALEECAKAKKDPKYSQNETCQKARTEKESFFKNKP